MEETTASAVLGLDPLTRVLLLNADDFGMHPAVDRGIIAALDHGLARSTSLMTVCPGSDRALDLLRRRPDILFGVHLTLVRDHVADDWRPRAEAHEVPSIVDDSGRFPLHRRSGWLLERARPDEVATEFSAQLTSVLDAGLVPTHLDFHGLADAGRPDLLAVAARLAHHHGLALRVWTQPPLEHARSAGLPVVDNPFLDSFTLDLATKEDRYEQMLRELRPGLAEWAVHPALDDPEARARDPHGWAVRVSDLRFLTSARAAEIIRRERILLIDQRPLGRVWRTLDTPFVPFPWTGEAPPSTTAASSRLRGRGPIQGGTHHRRTADLLAAASPRTGPSARPPAAPTKSTTGRRVEPVARPIRGRRPHRQAGPVHRTQASAPTTPSTDGPVRIQALDALRGLALCGILLVNIPPLAGMPPAAGPWRGDLTQWLELMAHQRFFPLFSFLFGLGTALFLDGAARRTARPRIALLRRLLVLGLLGAAHQLLQPGEALLPYAVVGVVVLLPATWLPRPVIALGGAVAVGLALAFTSGGLLLVPGLFLLGLAAARYGLHHRMAAPDRSVWAAVAAGAVVVAVPLLSVQVDRIEHSGFDRVSAAAGLATAVGYAAVLVLVTTSPVGPWVTSVLAPLGRLALTNYLSATLLVLLLTATSDLSGPDGHRALLPLAAAILAVQAVGSRWWVRRFRFGPVEWLWHSITWWSPARMV